MTPAPPPAPRRRPSRLAKAAWQLLAVALFLVAFEVALGLAGVQPLGQDPYAGFSGFRPLFVRDGDGWTTAPDKLRWFNRQHFAEPKPPGTLRVFSFGGSTTYGRPYDDRTSFSAWLAGLLDAAEPDRPHEVINCGGISYASYRVLEVLREALAHEPDALVVYTGHNEFLEERTYRDVAAAPAWLRAFGGLLSGTRSYALVHRLFVPADTAPSRADAQADGDAETGRDTGPAVSAEVATRLDTVVGPDAYERDDVLRARILAHFRHNLEAMIELAEQHDVPLILVTPASALTDCTPFKGDAAAGPERDADALYARGLVLLAQGRRAEARAALVAARDQDLCALRAPTEFVETVRAVAAEHGVPLFDFEAALAERGAEIPGSDWFLDHVHPTVAGHGVIAVGVAEQLAAAGLVRLPADFDSRVVPAVRADIEARLDPEFQGQALKNLAKVLSWAGKHVEAGQLAARSQQLLGTGDAETHFLLGNTARAAGQADAAAGHYRDAVALDPDYAEAWLNLAHVLAESGQAAAAEPAVRRALELLGPHASASELLGIVLRQLDRPDEAAAAFRQSLALEPDEPSTHLNFGLALLAVDDADGAQAQFEAAVALDPAYVKGHYNLGMLLLARGDLEAARTQLQAVVQLDPDHTRAAARLASLPPPP